MTVAFIAIFAALALFAASALVFVMMLGKPSPTETRLAALHSQSRAAYDTEAPGKLPSNLQAQDVFALITRPLAPFRDWLRSNDTELSYRLSIAGYRKPEDADTFLSLKLLAPVVGILLATFTGANFLLYGMFFAVGAFFVPDMWLFSAMSRRKAKINRALPDALDLLVICMEAGLGIDQAVLRIAKEIELVHPELSAELSIIGYEQRAGKPRLEAWRSMSDRVDLDTVRQFVAMLIQTERLGTPIAKSLGVFADALRVKRLMLAEEQAAKTTVKLIFPLAIFIFPALFVVLLGPGVLTIMKTFEDINR
jgi:tight adherence protein C